MLARLARSMGMTIGDVEDRHTLEQVILLWYLDVKEENRDREISASLTAANLAKVFAGG